MKPDLPAAKVVVCPACKGPSLYATSNPSRPFCSERCKGRDFGAWASESFRLPVDAAPDDEAEGGLKIQ
jgi:endogenous inhibitor of DNA gyrase (YacG/DUF329 family)